MAVKVVSESPGGGIEFQRRGRKTVRVYTRIFDVFTDDGGTGALEVLLASGLPKIGQSYATETEFDTGAICERVHPQQQSDNPFHWIVTATYSSEVELELTGDGQGTNGTGSSTQGGGAVVADPLKRRAVVDFDTRTRKVIPEKDYSDPQKAYCSSNREKYDPPIEQEIHNQLITIVRNTSDYDENILAVPYLNSVNRVRYRFQRPKTNGKLPPAIIIGPRAGRITKWIAREREENSVVYYENTIEIEVQYPSWDLEVLNQGSRGFTMTPGSGSLHGAINIYDNGVPIAGKVLLDRFGVALPDTSIAAALTGGAAAQTITPKSMFNIVNGDWLLIDPDLATEEKVQVNNVTAATFDAIVKNNHAANSRLVGIPTYKTYYPFPLVDWSGISALKL